jgi:hypothetical protein
MFQRASERVTKVPLKKSEVVNHRRLEEVMSRIVKGEDQNGEELEESAGDEENSDENCDDGEPVQAVDEPIDESDTAESIDLHNKSAECPQGKEKTKAHDA